MFPDHKYKTKFIQRSSLNQISVKTYNISFSQINHSPWELLYVDHLIVIAETEDDLIKRLNEWKNTTTTHSFNGLFPRTTWVSQKSRTIMVKPIWIYWSKRQWVAVASAGRYANLHFTRQRWKWLDGCVDWVTSKGLRERLGLDVIILVLQQNRLWWYGHVLRKEDNDWVKKCMDYKVEGAAKQS